MARKISNYELHKERIINIIKKDPAAVGCIYQELTGGECDDYKCIQCREMLIDFLMEVVDRPLSEKEIMFCRIAECGEIERRPDGRLVFSPDEGRGSFRDYYDIKFLDIFNWLESIDGVFDIGEYLESMKVLDE